jgi:hypothetical protein
MCERVHEIFLNNVTIATNLIIVTIATIVTISTFVIVMINVLKYKY